MRFTLVVDGREHAVEAVVSENRVTATVDRRDWSATVKASDNSVLVRIGDRRHEVVLMDGRVVVDGVIHDVQVLPGARVEPREEPSSAGAAGAPSVEAAVLPPMPGRVIRVLVEAGTEVDVGDPLLILEAMKMQNEIPSPARGTVTEVRVKEGDSVLAGDVLLTIA